MEEQLNDQSANASDHEKFGETGAFGAAAEHRVYDKVEESAETIRERAVQLKTSLADKLETGANMVRERSSDTGSIDGAIATTKDRVADAGDRVASGMEKSAEWLRDADMPSFKRGLERQVKENPGRTLLIAGAIGYLLSRAFKGKNA